MRKFQKDYWYLEISMERLAIILKTYDILVKFILKEMHKVIAVTYILLNERLCLFWFGCSKMDALWQSHFLAYTFLCYHCSLMLIR